MSETINFAPLVTLCVFVLGILFTPLLRRWDFFLASDKKKKLLLTELSDCRFYLKNIIIEHFKLLHVLEKEQDGNGNVGKIPVPLVTNFDLDFIKEYYKECLLILSLDERHLIRGVPEKLQIIKTQSSQFTSDVSKDNLYNQRAIRNILWAASTLYCELNELVNNKYCKDAVSGSIESTQKCLLEFGFTQDQIIFANALKSMLTDEQRNSLNTDHEFFVPE